jgi:hypothetical protein
MNHPGLVRTAGLEPTLPEGKQILSLLRLPISPRPHAGGFAHKSAGASLGDILGEALKQAKKD